MIPNSTGQSNIDGLPMTDQQGYRGFYRNTRPSYTTSLEIPNSLNLRNANS